MGNDAGKAVAAPQHGCRLLYIAFGDETADSSAADNGGAIADQLAHHKLKAQALGAGCQGFHRASTAESIGEVIAHHEAAIAQRLQVAKLLSEKKTYTEIEAITKASTATISRINKCLVYGADGYKRVLERLE